MTKTPAGPWSSNPTHPRRFEPGRTGTRSRAEREHLVDMSGDSIDWFKEKITGKSHISWENLWFPVKNFPSTNPFSDV